MYCVQPIAEGIYWGGVNDFVTNRFENIIPVPKGVSYNAYFIDDEKTAVVDTVDALVMDDFLESVEHLLHGRPLDYIIVNHMEPDHSSSLLTLAERYPTAKLCGSAQALRMFEQFFHRPMKERYLATGEKMTLSLGRRTLRFFTAPMVHWPEVTFTYDETDRVLFSADAFGCFGVLQGSVFADDGDYERDYADEARRYYACIVSKYGPQVLAAMKKVSSVPVDVIAPLHGPVFRTERDRDFILGKTAQWARWEPERRGAAVFYTSVYGHTATAAQRLAWKLRALGVADVKVTDLCKTDEAYAAADVLAYSHLVFASTTYNMGLYPLMRNFLTDLGDHLVQNRRVALLGNSSWAPNVAGKVMKDFVSGWKGCALLAEPVHILSAPGPKEEAVLDALAETVAADLAQGK